ncbi:hypothetical protein N7495_005360 [Penicillium taxi]|uniref:uncharacterized protein n=1 Tax=Penicillium taxi TaxID=168475 RepID=UPI0025453D01|nr:uncharacterized protein N7495_005360 [Penicillium taxi]KAJ5893669.1 hypothetical protein N7495_005360 [Penicillium taxi]
MSANLDKSLDDLVGNRQKNARRRNNRRGAATKPSVGGVKKSVTPKGGAKANAKVIHHATPAATSSKIIVSGLPSDVTEANIKEYFSKSAGPVKKVMLTYNQNGTSRGNAQIIFGKPDIASKAVKELNGILVDGRPIKIEVVYDASHAPAAPAPPPRSLTERVAQKSKPKPATAAKSATNTRTRAPRAERGGRDRQAKPAGRNAGRGKPKTISELDAEMVDYFAGDNGTQGNAPTNGAIPQATVDEDLGMGEIS